MLIDKKGKKCRRDLNILSFTWCRGLRVPLNHIDHVVCSYCTIISRLFGSWQQALIQLKKKKHTHTHNKKKKKKKKKISVQHVFKMLEYSLNSLFYGSMESCRLACHLLICLHVILSCFSTLPLNFRGGMCSLIAALPCDLFVVMKQSPITYFYMYRWTK